LKEWAEQYGPIYQINAFGTILVIISKKSIANDLMGLRGSIYSNRPASVTSGLITDNCFIGAAPWEHTGAE
jgi:hypothetical protein